MNDDLMSLFRKGSAVIMIIGRKGWGKTGFALRLGEDAYEQDLIKRIGSNIKTEDKRVDHVTTFYHLKEWLHQKGKKYFVFDEAGKHLARTRFMSSMNKIILDIIQLIRHYDAYFTAIAPSERFIDTKYLGSEILDCRIKKIHLKSAEVRNYLTFRAYMIRNIPRTTIRFWSKDIAEFSMETKLDLKKLSAYESAAYQWGKGINMDDIGADMQPPKHRVQVSRMIRKYLSMHFEKLSHSNK